MKNVVEGPASYRMADMQSNFGPDAPTATKVARIVRLESSSLSTTKSNRPHTERWTRIKIRYRYGALRAMLLGQVGGLQTKLQPFAFSVKLAVRAQRQSPSLALRYRMPTGFRRDAADFYPFVPGMSCTVAPLSSHGQR